MGTDVNATNGSAVNVNWTVIPMPSGAKIAYVTQHGKYLGSVQFDVVDKAALEVLGSMFQQFCAQQAGGIQIAGASALAGMRMS